MKPTVAGILCVLTLSRISAVSVNAADYTVTDLGPGTGVAINNSGNVVRNVTNQAFFHRGNSVVPIVPRLYWGDGSSVPLQEVSAIDVNDANIVLGSGRRQEYFFTGIFWWSESEIRVRDVVEEVDEYRVVALNNSGWTVGARLGGFREPSLTPANGQFVPDLRFRRLGSFGIGELLDVNDAGVEVGFLAVQGGSLPFTGVRARAAKVDQGVVTYLDTRPAGQPIYDVGETATRLSEAYAINEGGAVVGRMALEPGGPRHAFRHVGQGMEDLGTLGGLESEAFKINDSGLIVGRAQVGSGEWRAMIYENGAMIDLNTLLPAGVNILLTQANGVNNAGRIVADALIPRCQPRRGAKVGRPRRIPAHHEPSAVPDRRHR